MNDNHSKMRRILLLLLSLLLLLFRADNDLSKKRDRGGFVVPSWAVVVEAFGVVKTVHNRPTTSRRHLYHSIAKDKEEHTTKEAAGASKINNEDNGDQQQVAQQQEELQQLHPVLRNLLPHLDRHQALYGHANVPLGSSSPGGKLCVTLRRLRIQTKLSETIDVAYITQHYPSFIWHSLEDVYEQHDFEPLFQRLIEYGGDFSPPKKYAPDPELGAWVTALRRLYKINKVDPSHIQQLDAIGFHWITPSHQKCGSQFMKQYRSVLQQYEHRLPLCQLSIDDIDETTLEWIQAQQQKMVQHYHDNNDTTPPLSQTRQQYLRELIYGNLDNDTNAETRGGGEWYQWQPAAVATKTTMSM
jgi:hypothetical protein